MWRLIRLFLFEPQSQYLDIWSTWAVGKIIYIAHSCSIVVLGCLKDVWKMSGIFLGGLPIESWMCIKIAGNLELLGQERRINPIQFWGAWGKVKCLFVSYSLKYSQTHSMADLPIVCKSNFVQNLFWLYKFKSFEARCSFFGSWPSIYTLTLFRGGAKTPAGIFFVKFDKNNHRMRL